MSRNVAALRVLHVLAAGNAQSWAVQVADFIRLHNKGLVHAVACAEWDVWQQSAAKLSRAIKVSQPRGFPDLCGKSGIRALQALAQAMRSYDLILTYGEGALKAAMAHALFGPGLGLGALVHHLDENPAASGLLRNWYRMIALSRASAVIAPSRAVAEQALQQWRQPAGKVHYVPHGIDTAACGAKPKLNALPRVVKRDGELWIGTTGGSLSALSSLLSALPALGEQWQLVILGQVSARDTVLAEAIRLEVGHRVHLPGVVEDTGSVIGLFDVFAASDGVADAPMIKQAVAAGLAIAGNDTAGLREWISPDNIALIGQGDALALLTQDPVKRREIGVANRAFAKANFDLKVAMAQRATVCAKAMGRDALSA